MQGDVKNRLGRPVRLTVAEGTEITAEVIEWFLNANKRNLDRYRLLENYYHNETGIQRRRLDDPDKPNNRISHAFAKYITKVSTAFFMGRGIRIEAEPPAYKEALDDAGDTMMAQIRHFEEAKEMGRCGVSFEWLYFDSLGQPRSKNYGAGEMIPVFSQSRDRYLAFVLHPYRIQYIAQSKPDEEFVDVIEPELLSLWKKPRGGRWELQERFSHGWSDVPVLIRQNNAELKGDFEDVIPQIDSYDKAQSDTQNDIDYFSDAYLALTGVSELAAEDENGDELSPGAAAKAMKQNRMLYLPEGCKAEFITKQADDAVTEHHKDRLRNDIFFLSQVPNLTDESFAGNLSGVAIKYKLFGLEELVMEKEAYFTSSELKKVRLLTDYLNIRNGTNWDWKDVKLRFDRSAVANTLETAQIINYLRDVLSDKTLVGMWPEVEDAAGELAQKQMEQERLENLGGFGGQEKTPPDGEAG